MRRHIDIDFAPASLRRSVFHQHPAWLLLAALALLLFTLVYRPEGFRNTLRYTLQGVALVPLFWLAVRHPQWGPFRLLNLAPVRRLGALSYAFYLCHFYLIHVAEALVPQRHAISAALALLLSLLFASVVYRVIELPCARWRQRLQGRGTQPRPASTAPPLGALD